MIIKQIKTILDTDDCSCYSFNEDTLTVIHEMPIEEARYNDCNNRIFTQITGFLLENDVEYEVSSNNDIIIKM